MLLGMIVTEVVDLASVGQLQALDFANMKEGVQDTIYCILDVAVPIRQTLEQSTLLLYVTNCRICINPNPYFASVARALFTDDQSCCDNGSLQ